MSIELNFLERGSGPPLVLVPGWSQTARGFRKQLDGLADDFRVIAIDQRGHGDSPKPADGYRIAR
ncbi:MAG: alpha/beta fold hydrolase, partial [Gammaproteobacteria bacterium]